MKKIPIKNYIYAFLIIVVTLLLVFKLMDIYKKNNKIDFITKVNENDLQQFILEKNDVFIYFSKNNNKVLEQDLKKYLDNNEIKNDIIYVDLNDTSKDFEKKFNNNFMEVTSSAYINITNPTLIYIEDGKINDVLVEIKNIDEIKSFIGRNTND